MKTRLFSWSSLIATLCCFLVPAAGQNPGAEQAPPSQFITLCATCHGEEASGTDRGPALVNSRKLRGLSQDEIRGIIRDGTQGGMPPFALPAAQLEAISGWIHGLNASAFDLKPAGNVRAGEAFFFGKGNCANCHMIEGRGGTNGPDLSSIARQLTVSELDRSLDDPSVRAANRSSSSCPGWAFCPENVWAVGNVRLADGSTLRGFIRNRALHDLQLQTLDGRFHLLLENEYTEVSVEGQPLMPPLSASADERRDLVAYLSRRGGIPIGPLKHEPEPVSSTDINRILAPERGAWPTYNGNLSGNRHSPLGNINTTNASQLVLQWSYAIPYTPLETTPLVSDGIMFVTGPNRVCALDARTGRQIWCYVRPRSSPDGISGDSALGANRGVALLGDRVFFNTDDAHLICLNRITGSLMWDVEMPESDLPGPYGSTGAPLVVNDLVIAGVGGGDMGIRGFLDAYKVTTGERAWRFWTVPARGEPGSETWSGDVIELGGGATWLSGSHDPESGVLYWTTGNPWPDTDATERAGTNLYTNAVIALDVKTGKLKWYFQFTPNDVHDWDATEPVLLVHAKFQGRDRKLLLQANRNGFYYVLDRTSGEFLLGEPFVEKLTWASGIDESGVPILLPGNEPTLGGTKSCPAVRGATNWYSTAYHPGTRLLYVMAVEDCTVYQKARLGGFLPYRNPDDPPRKVIRALEVETGKIAWEIPQIGTPDSNYSGVLSTDGGLVFYGENGGSFAAVDAATGKTLWHFNANQVWKGSPITYTVKGKQYVAIASGGNILSFALPH
jgi:PQQ-dependent dehydrogenase (methanol/ethanol family)